jgi:O-succinylbenzoate synthase
MKFRFQYRRYRLPFRAPVRTAHGVWSEREGIIVRVEDEAGCHGLGEAAPIPAFGTETVEEDEAGCRAVGEWTEAETLGGIPARLACLRNAVAGAQAERERRKASAAEMPEPSAAELRPYLGVAALLPAGRAALTLIGPRAELGFRVFKWKVGVGDPADEFALLDDVCAALPAGGRLRLDANGAWDRRRAAQWLERCAERPVEFVEQPIAPDARGSQDSLLGLAGDFPTPLALDESLVGEADVERWIGAGWPGVFVVKPALLGDVAGALGRLERARAAVVFSSALETAVGAKAALRAAFTWAGEPRALGFGVWPLFVAAPANGPAALPFLRREDVERIDPEALWTALA